MTDGDHSITFGELISSAEATASMMSGSRHGRFFLDGVSDIQSVIYVYASYMSGKELLMVPGFLPTWIKSLIKAQYGFPKNIKRGLGAESKMSEGRIILSTSGTEGRPRQIAPNNGLFSSSFDDILIPTGISEKSTVYSPAPFVAAPVPVLISLAAGATVRIEPNRSNVDNATGCDSIICLPSFAEKNYEKIRTFKNVMCATQPFSQNLNMMSKRDGINIWDVYSSTETGIVGTRLVSDTDLFSIVNSAAVSVKSPDSHGAGEISVENGYTMQGHYLNGKYVPRTGPVTNGDIVRIDGARLDLIARGTGSKIKVSGYSVYVPYIEMAVSQVAPGGKVFVAMGEQNDDIIVTVPLEFDRRSVFESLRSLLPWYMMPKRIEYGI